MLNVSQPQRSNDGFQKKRIILFISGFIILVMIASSSISAQGNLILMQKRVLFEGGQTTQVLEFGNFGQDSATYVVSILHMRMTENGAFVKITEPDSGELFADNYIRIYPHTITLAPNESQTMKIQLINTADIKPGEYRSHLYFRADKSAQEKSRNTEEKNEGISVSLVPAFGITIPVIVRVGTSTSSVTLTDLDLESQGDTSHVLNFSFHRSGNFSVYGDVSVAYLSPKGKETEVEKVRGVAVYTPGSIRNTRLNLKSKKGIDFHNGKLIVRYTESTEEKGQLFAEAELQLH